MTKTTTKRTGGCPVVLELLEGGERTGHACCRLPKGHPGDEHRASWEQTAGDERSVLFAAGDRYDIEGRKLVDILGAAARAAATSATPEPRRLPVQTSAQPPSATVQIASISLEDLVESPFNKRRTWGNLKELAASMGNGVGIVEPLLARLISDGKYELVFGHRRFRAAKLAELKAAPVMVRELSDDVALEMQAIENLQRVDLHPLEEAEGYEQLMTMLHWSADDVAAKVGKSRSYIYGRLKLCELGAVGRKLFADGELSASIALLVARVPATLQEKAIAELRRIAPLDEEDWDKPSDAPKSLRTLSYRAAREELEELFMLDLRHAPFDTKDGSLVPAAGTCAACPKRSGNQRLLFADVDSADACTDPTCFADKRAAHNGRIAEKLAAKGTVVLEAKRDRFDNVRPPAGHVRLTDFCQEAGKPWKEVLEKARAKAPRTPALKDLQKKHVVLDNNGKSVEVVRTKGLLDAAGIKPKAERRSGRSTFDHKAYQAKRELEEKQKNAILEAMVLLVEEEGSLSLDVLRLVVGETAEALGFCLPRRGERHRRGEAQKLVAKASEGELAGMLVELTFGEADDKTLDAIGKNLGVNAAAIRKRVVAEVAEAKGQLPPEPEPEKTKKGAKPARKK